MLSVAICADGSVFDASLDGVSVDARVEFLSYVRMTRSARGRDLLAVDMRGGIDSFGYFVTAVAIHAVCRLAVPAQQRLSMDAVFISRDEAGGRGSACPHIRIVEMAGEAHALLRDFQFLGVPAGLRCDVIPMTCEARGTAVDSLALRFAMGRLGVRTINFFVAGRARGYNPR
ncbi:MAG: hypothetical protein HBSIN02_14090 [Bacteroidia bacterium]|nr:MAG: hypothetical protein HBSIN02_14090 [Bacteroidia bacterium]